MQHLSQEQVYLRPLAGLCINWASIPHPNEERESATVHLHLDQEQLEVPSSSPGLCFHITGRLRISETFREQSTGTVLMASVDHEQVNRAATSWEAQALGIWELIPQRRKHCGNIKKRGAQDLKQPGRSIQS